jgi:hypothetical protein
MVDHERISEIAKELHEIAQRPKTTRQRLEAYALELLEIAKALMGKKSMN